VSLPRLTTRELLDWVYVTMCRDAAGGVDWHEVRGKVQDGLTDIYRRVMATPMPTPTAAPTARPRPAGGRVMPNPDTWGLEPEHVAGQARLQSSLRTA